MQSNKYVRRRVREASQTPISVKRLSKAARTRAALVDKDEMYAYVKEEMAKPEARMLKCMSAFKLEMMGEMHALGTSMYAKWKEEMQTYSQQEMATQLKAELVPLEGKIHAFMAKDILKLVQEGLKVQGKAMKEACKQEVSIAVDNEIQKSKEAIAAMEASVSKVQENVEKNVHTWAEMAKDAVDKETSGMDHPDPEGHPPPPPPPQVSPMKGINLNNAFSPDRRMQFNKYVRRRAREAGQTPISVKRLSKAARTRAAPVDKDEMYAYVKEEMAKVEARMLEWLKAEGKAMKEACKQEVSTAVENEIQKSKEAIAAMEASVSKVQENVEKKVHTWAEMAKDAVDKEVKECAPWIEVVKKNKGMPSNQMEVMNATLEEEAKRKGRHGDKVADSGWPAPLRRLLRAFHGSSRARHAMPCHASSCSHPFTRLFVLRAQAAAAPLHRLRARALPLPVHVMQGWARQLLARPPTPPVLGLRPIFGLGRAALARLPTPSVLRLSVLTAGAGYGLRPPASPCCVSRCCDWWPRSQGDSWVGQRPPVGYGSTSLVFTGRQLERVAPARAGPG
ncbi:hypothetical protein L7F22_063445 [Adiantum nelumboides]|nr:hypothetical protein [Adiantum nelumboides]